MRVLRFIVFFAMLALPGRTVSAEIFATQSLDRYFRIETHVERRARGPVVWGYVYNNTNLMAEKMTVKVETLDASGAVVGSTTTWVPGTVPGNNRAYFETRAAEGAQYRVQVLSFDWTGRGSGF